MDVIYARQSIDKKDSVSIEAQIEFCRKFAADAAQVFQDKGFSGKNIDRPAFRRLMEAVDAGQVDKIYVYRLDRFSRSIVDFGQVWNILDRHSVEFVSVTENFDTSSPVGRAMLNIVLVFAQLERETIAERVRDNYRHRFSLGAWPGGPAPYGYDLTKIADEEGRGVSSLTANECSAVVTRIFEQYASKDASLRSVAQSLNDEGIPGPKRRAWDNVTLSRILHSPLYVRAAEDVYWWYLAKGLRPMQEPAAFDGIHACNVIGKRNRSKGKYQDLDQQHFSLSNHQGFIPAELWLRCQAKLEQNTQIAQNTAAKHSWLTGLLKCGSCGYAIKIAQDSQSGKYYLNCSGRSNMGICSEKMRIDLRELEEAAARSLREILAQCPPEEIHPADTGAANELQHIERRIERLVTVLSESGEVTVSYISAQIEKLHRQKEKLLRQLERKTGHGKMLRLDFDKAGFAEKKMVAGSFIEKILIQDDNVDIIWKV